MHRRGLVLSKTPDVLNDCVADTAVGALIDVMRGLSASDRYIRRGDWSGKGSFPLARKFSGTTVGIDGFGRIGLAFTRQLEGFRHQHRLHNRNPRIDVQYQYFGSLLDLAKRSDVIIVAAAGGTSTKGLISSNVLRALEPNGFIVIVARGSITDEPALVEALVRRRIAGAARFAVHHRREGQRQ